jgi:hypothetical protein
MALSRDTEVRAPQRSVPIRDFQGMASNFDPTDLKPGVSRLQVNVNGYQRGRLEVRRGLRKVTFESTE